MRSALPSDCWKCSICQHYHLHETDSQLSLRLLLQTGSSCLQAQPQRGGGAHLQPSATPLCVPTASRQQEMRGLRGAVGQQVDGRQTWPNEAMMEPERSLSWGAGSPLTNVLLTSREQPDAELRWVPAREQKCEG